MRLIKLSKSEFTTAGDVDDYFFKESSDFRSRNPLCGVFIFPKGWLAKNGVNAGETVLFSYSGRIRYAARAFSGREAWDGPEAVHYRYCLKIDYSSIRLVDMSFAELEELIKTQTGKRVSLKGQGWTKLPDSLQV